MPVDFHPEAAEEAEQAFDYLAARSPPAADRFDAELELLLRRIARRPAGYPAAEEDARFRSAAMTTAPDRLKYREVGGGVQILAVAHAKRRPGYWRDRAA